MAKDHDTGGKGDHLKYYCIVFGILVVVIAVVAFQQRGKLNAYKRANAQARAALMAKGTTPDGRPRAIGDLAVEVEKFVQGYKESLGSAGDEGVDGISTRMIQKAGSDTEMMYQFAGTEQDDPNRAKGFRTRSREFTYNLSTLDQLTKLVWNIEALGRYRVFELRWKLADKKVNAEPPYFKVNKPVIRVGYRSPLTRR